MLLKNPHLIPTVVSTDPTLPPLLSDVLNLGYSILRLDCGTQTPTHFVESHIDPTCVELFLSPTLHCACMPRSPVAGNLRTALNFHIPSPLQIPMERVGAAETSYCSCKPAEQGDKELPDDPQGVQARQRHTVLGAQDSHLANALQPVSYTHLTLPTKA